MAVLWSRSQKGFKISMTVHLDDISSTAKPFVAKLGIVVHQHGRECRAKRVVCYFQGQGHSEGLYKINMTFCHIY